MTEEKCDPPSYSLVEEVSEEEAAEKTIEEEKYKACVSALAEVLNSVYRVIQENAKKYLALLGWEPGLYIAKLGGELVDLYEGLKRKLCECEVSPPPEDAKKKMLITLAEKYKKEAEYKPPLKTRLRYLFKPEEGKREKAVRDFYRAILLL